MRRFHPGRRPNRSPFSHGRPGPRDQRSPQRDVRKTSEDEAAFLKKTSIDPFEYLSLEKGSPALSGRMMDILCPIGKGQRGLIVAPPKAGKTTILKDLAKALSACDPSLKLYSLLIDERPEEVVDFKRTTPAEVHASSNDRPYEEHVRVAQTLLQKAVSEANAGKDVVILLDSLTRLSRVYNTRAEGRRTMSGGLDSRAMEIPRRFFGMARKLEEGGSLTILATILVETGSQMDQVIFQEFKGTGNMELVLSRECAERRVFPAINISATGTRKEERLIPPERLQGVYTLRKALASLEPVAATTALVELLQKHPTNAAALEWVKQAKL